MTCSLFPRGILWHISQKLEELLDSILHQEYFHVHNDSCIVSYESVDVNLDFWHLGLWAPPQPWKQLKWLGLIGLTLFRPRGLLAHPQWKILITTELVQVSSSYFVTFLNLIEYLLIKTFWQFVNIHHRTCPYLECGYNGKYLTGHSFQCSWCNLQMIHYWKALGKCYWF